MIDWLNSLDHDFFSLINGSHSAFWDEFMYYVSNKFTWIPAYLFLLIALYRQIKWPEIVPVLIVVPLLILLSDQLASGLIKPFVERPRPCHEAGFSLTVYTLNGKCGGPFGFVSSHASNFFAMATYFGMLFARKSYKWLLLFYLIALLVGYSRVYLGVHFPGDILGGAVIGIISGFISLFLLKFVKKLMHRGRQN